MSDPVSNVEIEDVLSSIRRLVSTEDRTDDASEENSDASEAGSSEEKVADKLVLTPALRVSEADSDRQDPSAAQDNTPEASDKPFEFTHYREEDDSAQDEPSDGETDEIAPSDDGGPERDVRADDDRGEDDAAVEDQGDDHDDDHSEDHGEDHSEVHGEDIPDAHADDQSDGSDQPLREAEADHEAEPDADTARSDPQDENHNAEGAARLSSRAAGFEDAVAARDDDWEPDGDDDNDNAAKPMDRLSWQDDDDAEESAVQEAEIVSPTEGLEPYAPEEDDATIDAAASLHDTPAPETQGNAFMGAEDPLGDDMTVLDEDALRDLVTEIVRQELQGSLGERITRNVRKLVRREIHRALATKELE